MSASSPQKKAAAESAVKRVLAFLQKSKAARLINFALMGLAVAFAVWVVLRDGAQLRRDLIQPNFALVGLAFAVACLGFFMALLVWRSLIQHFGVHQSFRNDLRIYSYGVVSSILPGGIWSIVSRSFLYDQQLGVNKANTVIPSVVELLLISLAALLVYAVTAFMQPQANVLQNPWVGLGCAGVMLVLLYPPVFNYLCQRIFARLAPNSNQASIKTVKTVRLSKLIGWCAGESLVLAMGGLTIYVLLLSLTPAPPQAYVQILAVWCAATFASAFLFWLPGVSILKDGALVLALGAFMSSPYAIAFVVFQRICLFVFPLLFAIMVFLTLDLPFRAK